MDNIKRKASVEKIERTFIQLIQKKNIEEISVSMICEIAGLNRSTFYANYIDIYDLVDKIKDKMINEFFNVYLEECKEEKHSYNFLKLFHHINDHILQVRSAGIGDMCHAKPAGGINKTDMSV